MKSTAVRFEDLPRVRDGDDGRRVHSTTGLYFVSRGGVAHDALDRMFVDIDKLLDRPGWRVATAAQVRAIGARWCVACCE